MAELQELMGEFKVCVDVKQNTLTINSAMVSETVNFSVQPETETAVVLQAQGAQFSFEIKGADRIVLKSNLFGNQGMPLRRVK